METKKLKLRSLNPHIVCLLCAGYFVDATTVVECLHTFCKSCIVRYLQIHKNCPTCGVQISETEPLSKLMLDRTMQDIIVKILPHIAQDEKNRKMEFQKRVNKIKDADRKTIAVAKPTIDLSNFSSLYRNDEQINLCMELDGDEETSIDSFEIAELRNKFIRCSSRVRITELKNLISKFYELSSDDYQIIFKCNKKELRMDDHLHLVFMVHWKRKPQPMVLTYGFRRRPLTNEESAEEVIEILVSSVEKKEKEILDNLFTSINIAASGDTEEEDNTMETRTELKEPSTVGVRPKTLQNGTLGSFSHIPTLLNCDQCISETIQLSQKKDKEKFLDTIFSSIKLAGGDTTEDEDNSMDVDDIDMQTSLPYIRKAASNISTSPSNSTKIGLTKTTCSDVICNETTSSIMKVTSSTSNSICVQSSNPHVKEIETSCDDIKENCRYPDKNQQTSTSLDANSNQTPSFSDAGSSLLLDILSQCTLPEVIESYKSTPDITTQSSRINVSASGCLKPTTMIS